MFYKLIRFLANVYIHIAFRMRFEGLENVPAEGGYILASNHRSYFDPPFLVVKIKAHFRFMAKEELFKGKVFGAIIRALGAFPVARGKGDTGAIDTAKQIVRDKKEVLLIFPEGTRSKDGVPLRARSGIALIAGQTGASVLPCSVDYGAKLSFRTPVTVKFHPVITAEELAVDTSSPSSLRAASKKVMEVITSGLTHIPPQKNAGEEEKSN